MTLLLLFHFVFPFDRVSFILPKVYRRQKLWLPFLNPSYAALNLRQRGVSPEMALRLAKAFDTTPDLWITMQRNYDLHQASQKFNADKAVKQVYSSRVGNRAAIRD